MDSRPVPISSSLTSTRYITTTSTLHPASDLNCDAEVLADEHGGLLADGERDAVGVGRNVRRADRKVW